jgi:hypothetical protein
MTVKAAENLPRMETAGVSGLIMMLVPLLGRNA